MSIGEQSKRVSVFLSQQDHERLIKLARKAYRTSSGYMRWLLQQHFEEEYTRDTSDGKEQDQIKE